MSLRLVLDDFILVYMFYTKLQALLWQNDACSIYVDCPGVGPCGITIVTASNVVYLDPLNPILFV